MFTHLPYSLHIMPDVITRDMATISKMSPTIVLGLAKLRVPRQNPSVGSVPPRANRGRDKATQMMVSS
jgi:hypothetical protein